MSNFSGNIGREEEDGGGWGGLVPDKEERREASRRAKPRPKPTQCRKCGAKVEIFMGFCSQKCFEGYLEKQR